MNWSRLRPFLPMKRLRDAPPKVAALRLSGVIGGSVGFRQGLTLAAIEPLLEKAFGLPELTAVALIVNSPGGSPVQSDLIAQRIRDLAVEKDVPILAFCEDVAASGGYWLAAAADEIYVRESSILGSIGVISAGFGFQGLIGRFGIERRLHTAGSKKSMLDPFSPEDPEDVARLKVIHQEVHGAFQRWVTVRRGDKLKGDPETLFSGEFWTGPRAVELGLADGLGEARGLLRQRYGEKVKILPVKPRQPWWKSRFAGASLPVSGAGLLHDGWASDLLSALEERALWSRFGL